MTSNPDNNPNCQALRDDLIALLYDDGDVGERSRARDHLAGCVPCRAEYAELKSVRKTLGGWNLPATESVLLRRVPSPWASWGLAAAAGLLLGLGVAVIGRNTLFPQKSGIAAASAEASPASFDSTSRRFVSHEDLQTLLAKQESRYQEEIADLRLNLQQVAEANVTPAMGPKSAANNGRLRTASDGSPAVLERLLRASEERQARLIEARLTGLRTESELQRQYDMAQIAAGLAYIDSRTGADAARTSELMKNLVRVTAKPQQR